MENNCVGLNIKEVLELAKLKVENENIVLKNSLFSKIKDAITNNFKNENQECRVEISKDEHDYLDNLQDYFKKEDIFVSKEYRIESVDMGDECPQYKHFDVYEAYINWSGYDSGKIKYLDMKRRKTRKRIIISILILSFIIFMIFGLTYGA